MKRTLKLSTVVLSVSLAATLIGVAPSLASTPVSSPKIACKATDAVGHTPRAYRLPKTSMGSDKTQITLFTNCGNIVFTAFGKKAPTTVGVFSFLAKAGYFNKTLCHRIVTSGIYVLQCGDPTASGMGTPGFKFKDENLPASTPNNYPAGSIAMANAGPGTNGSQFFIVYKDTSLPPAYTIWGKVTSGLNVVQYIATQSAGTADGSPRQPIAILKVSVK